MPPRPIALCLEDLGAASAATRYLCCVALPGRQVPTPPVEVREHPPAEATPPRKPDVRPIEVRASPPKMTPPEDENKK